MRATDIRVGPYGDSAFEVIADGNSVAIFRAHGHPISRRGRHGLGEPPTARALARARAHAETFAGLLLTTSNHYHCANGCEHAVAELRCVNCGGAWVPCSAEVCK